MALGKNLKRVKLLPETESEKKKSAVKKVEKKVKSPTVKAEKAKSKPSKKKSVAAKNTKPTAKETPRAKPLKKKTGLKSSKQATVPQAHKPKKLSEKERQHRQERRESYIKELSSLKNIVTSWIIFEVEQELFAIDIAMTQRVIPTPEISNLPHTAAHITGVAEVRKRPVIFVDLSKKYGLNIERSGSDGLSYALIVKPSVDLVAILLKSVPQTLKINGNQLIPLPETANLIPNKESFIKFMYKLEDKIVYMLDIEGLLLADQGILEVKSQNTPV